MCKSSAFIGRWVPDPMHWTIKVGICLLYLIGLGAIILIAYWATQMEG